MHAPPAEESATTQPGWAARGLIAALAVGLVLAALALPLWRAQLIAPQYPDNLHLIAYGTQVAGDVEEIDLLNHYVGMKAFDPADVPEMALWPFAVGGGVLAALVGVLVHQRWPRRLALLYLWATPLGVVGAIQLRLHQYGHDIDPMAALRIPEFTPLVFGPTEVLNFTTWSYPGLGLLALLAAAGVVTFGPRLVDRVRIQAAPVAAALLTGALLVAPAAPALAADHGHDHGNHAHGSHAHGSHAGHGEAAVERTEPRDLRSAPATAPGSPAVRGDGPARDLAALLAGVEAGDTVSLAPGRWQGPATIDVPITLHGLGRAVIEGDGTGSVLTVLAAGTTITGVHVRGSGPGPADDPAGIKVKADDVRIESVVVEDSYVGIGVAGADRVHLVGNTVLGRTDGVVADEGHALAHDDEHGGHDDGHHPDHDQHGDDHVAVPAVQKPRGDGISLWDADGVLVRGNHVHDSRDGIYVSFGSGALLDGNHVAGSRYAVHSMFARDLTLAENHFEDNLSGAVLMYGGPALLLRNEITDHRSAATGFGVLLKDIDQVEAIENVIARNRLGFHLDISSGASAPARIHRNTIADGDIAVTVTSATDVQLSANSFIRNRTQVAPQGGGTLKAQWTAEGWGNYWDTYRGYESAIAGRGATPHHEGGRVDTLLQRAPVLAAISSSPGVRLLRELEARWTTRIPSVVDDLPLTRPLSPPVPVAPANPTSAPIVAVVAAVALLGCLVAIVRLRRPRPVKELT
jgi:nitrous oxidase accessory protein